MKTLSSILIQPMTFQQLKSTGQLKLMQQRTEECKLCRLAQDITTLEQSIATEYYVCNP